MDIGSRPRWVTLIIAGLIVTCVLRILPVSILLADESVRVGNSKLKESVTQSNGVDWWPMFHHDQNHTGYSTSTAPNTNHVRWSFKTDSPIDSSPAVVDGKVYVGLHDLYCLDASTGGFLWSYPTRSWESSPAVADGKVYIGSWDGNFYCLDASNGDYIWSYPTGGDVQSSPTVVNGKVYVGSYDGMLYCFDASNGDKLWGYPAGGERSSPAVADGRVYVGSWGDNFYCLDASTGGFLWSYPAPWVQSSPAVVDGKVYLGSDNGLVYCLDASNGDYIWHKLTGGCVQSSPAVADGKVYIGSFDHNVFCLDASNGDYIWSYPTGGCVRSSPAVVDGKVYVGSDDHNVYCLDASNGDYIWSYLMGGWYVFSSPAVADDRVYIGSEDGVIYAFQDVLVVDIVITNFYDNIVANFRIDDPLPIIKTRTFDGSRWQPLSPPIPEPRTAPFSPSVTINPEPYLYEPLLTLATTINPEPYVYEANIVIRQYDGVEWSGPTPVPYTNYGSNPAVAALPSSDELFLFWENTNSTPTHTIALSIYNQTNWTTMGYFLGEGETPTATFYNDEIYALWKKDDGLIYRVYNPANESWSEERGQTSPFLIDPQPSPCPPKITSHDGLLYLVYESESVYLHTFNGTGWSGPYALQNYGTLSPSKPAITSFNDQLYIFYISDGEAYYQTLEGSLDAGVWSTPREVPSHLFGIDWWPMFHHDPYHTGYSTSTAPDTNNTLWSYTTGDWVESSPAVFDGRVYIGSDDDNVYCLNAKTGTEIWNYTTGDIVYFSSPAVADNKVYVGSGLKIYCLNALTGAHIWNYTTGAGVPSSPAVFDGRVYAGSIDNKVYCLNASTGQFIWSYTTGDDVYSSPAIAYGLVYIGSDDNHTYCLNATTGDVIWSYTTGSSVRSSPSVTDGKVYVGSADNKIYCLNASTGQFIWDYTTGDRVLYSSPAVVNDKIFVGSEDHRVYCLNATTGDQIWSYTTGGMIWSSPAVADNKVYFGSHDYKIYCLNASTGVHIWNYTTGSYVHSSPAVAAGMVFIGSYDNNVYAFGPPPGTHDVAVANISLSKTVIGQNFTGTFWVTVENQGDFSEVFNVSAFYDGSAVPVPQQWPTPGQLDSFWSLGDVNRDGYVDNFDVCLIAAAFGTSDPDCDLNGDGVVNVFDANICAGNYGLDIWTHLGLPQSVGNETIVNLPSGGSLSVAFRWNTTGVAKGNYTISAMADTVPGETDIVDNNFTDSWIIIARIGDITGSDGWPDGACDMMDVATIARRFGEQCGTPLYHINYDITGSTTGMADGTINMMDVATVAKHFGEIDP